MKNRLLTKRYLSIVFILFFSAFSTILAQDAETGRIWQKISESEISLTGKRYSFPEKYNTLRLDKAAMQILLSRTSMEPATTARITNGIPFYMPMPDGSFQQFSIVEYHVLHPELAARYPGIKTYTGQGIDDPSATIKLDMTPQGFHAMVISPKGQFFVDPFCQNNTIDYIIYDKKDLRRTNPFLCEVTDEFNQAAISEKISSVQKSSGTQLRTYRLALAATGEYTTFHGGTVALGLAAMATSMNRVNGVYETEVAIRMVIIATNNLIVYTNSATDPYTNSNGSTMLTENTNTLNSVIGTANYDIGHVFSTGGGGVASLNSPCGTSKARGVTGRSAPIGDAFDIDYVAHEMGHQFGGNHTFNSATGNCAGGNRNASTAYEPGSGITIQAYAGICGADDLAPNSIAYFHTISFDEIVNFSQTGNGNTCPVITSTGNTAPVVTSMGAAYSIPISTAFVLTGAATDADNDPLTYCWEEFDLGAAGAWNVQSTTAPMFRTFPPTSSPSRTFPKISDIINNTTTIGELLPNQARTLKFRLTARDNRTGGGGVMHQDVNLSIAVVNNGGAFSVTSPNTGVTWAGNSTQTVTWNVNGTTNAPISTANVKISLSTDGGNTFPTVILASTANDGTENITVPNIATTQARIKVEAVGNIYFDMSNINFVITAATGLTTITTSAISPLSYCAGAAISVPFTTNGAANAGNIFTAQLSNPAGIFESPFVTIGTLASTTAGTIAATIDGATLAGTQYRIRVVSSNPAVNGSDNGSNITVLTSPAPAVITAGGPVTFCAGGNVLLSGNSAGGTWSVGGGTTSTLLVNSSGDYFVTTTNSCGTTTSNHIIVNVNPLPVVTAANVSGCQGIPITLSGSPAGGFFSVANPYTGPSTTYTYTYTNANGCTNTSTAASITVNPLPVVNAGTYGPVTTSDPVVALNGTPAGGVFSGTGVSGNNFNPATAGIGTFTITYTYTNANNCTDFASTSITVNPPVCNFTTGTIAGPLNACAHIGPSDPDATYSIAATNASSFTWTVPTNASIVSGQGTNSIVVHYSAAFVSGYLGVTVGNGCGGANYVQKVSVRTTLPSTPGSITGPANACLFIGSANAATYTIRKASNSFSYIWTVPAGATITSHPGGTGVNDTIITVTFNNTFVSGGLISVRGASSCGTSSSARTLAVTRTNPSVPVSIMGITDVCPIAGTATTATYTIRKNANAASFIWTVPANATITGRPGGIGTANDTIILVLFSGAYTTGAITAAAVNGCATSAARSLTVTKTLPATPAKIYGDPNGTLGPITPAATDACPYVFSGTDAVYSINKVKVPSDPSGFASGYNWVLTDPVNAHIVSHPAGTGANDTIITVHFDAGYTTGSVQVQSVRNCGTSILKSVTVTKKAPATPDPITGLSTPCPLTSQTYTVNAVNATTYNWTVPSTMSITAGQGTNTVTIQFLANYNGGTIRVSTTSTCGTSAARSFATTKCVAPRPSYARLTELENKEMSVYPNPSNGNFSVTLSTASTFTGIALLEIINEFGQVIYQSREQNNNGMFRLNLQHKLTNGVYLVRCTMNKQVLVKKLMISK